MKLVPKFLRKKNIMDKLSEGTVTYKRLPETLCLETDSFINIPKISLIYGIYIYIYMISHHYIICYPCTITIVKA